MLTVEVLVKDSDQRCANPALVALLLSADVLACDEALGERCADRGRLLHGDPVWSRRVMVR